jgi:hypothetical protein
MLPFRYFESDTSFMDDKLLRDAFDVFREDSRALYRKHNLNVSEKVSNSSFASLRYSIRLGSLSDDQGNQVTENPVLMAYGLEKINYSEDQCYWLVGKFLDRREAELALADVQTRTEFKGLRVVKRVVGETSRPVAK